jgi:hypothetical protein
MGRVVSRISVAVVACAVLVAASGCGEDEEPATDAATVSTLPGPSAEAGQAIAPIAPGTAESVLRVRPASSPEGESLLVGHVLFADREQAEDARLRLRIGSRIAEDAEDAVLAAGGSAARVLACVCEIPAEAATVELEVRGSGRLEVEARSLTVVDDVEVDAGAGGDSGLPAPLSAAVISPEPQDITDEPAAIVTTEMADVDAESPALMVGVVQSASSSASLDAVQIDGAIGDERVPPRGSLAQGGAVSAFYTGTVAPEQTTVALVSGTADGTTPLAGAALFACPCRLSADAPTPPSD